MNEGNLLCMPRADFLYRDTESIRDDISVIRQKIAEVKRSFSIRELLIDMLSDTRERKPREWIFDLEGVISQAESAYSHLSELREELDYLREELREAKCRINQ